MDVHTRFTMPVIIEMRRQIEQAGGNEVFFTGIINECGIVTSVTAAARGNESEVPVNFEEQRKASVLIHNHPSGILLPSDADLNVASNASENAQGFYIINNDVTNVYVVMEPIKPVAIEKLVPEETASYLSKDGPLARTSPMYEERPSQLKLVESISESFNKNAVGVFEAGTGVGKSFAYLIPAMLWALKNKERVVISTGTINLQQQLMEKDIPAAEKIIGKNVKAVLLKGRQNYVCLRRLDDAGHERDLFNDDTEMFDKIASWAKETSSGSRSDLSFQPKENVWSRINSESDACMGMRCQFREQCFVMRARKEASDANIIVVNHHLLFADIESRMNGVGYEDAAVLPPYKRIVFDEAHGIENAATSFFSESITRFKLIKQLNLLYRQRRNASAGYLYTLAALSSTEDNTAVIEEEVSQTKLALQNLEIAAFDVIGNDWTLRLFDGSAARFRDVLPAFGALQTHTAKLAGLVRDLIETIPEDDKDNPIIYETRSVLRRLDDVCVLCKNFAEWDEHKDSVFWMQKLRLSPEAAKGQENPMYLQFVQTPLDIAPLMNTGVFEAMETVVCTSATLSIGKNFDFWKRRTGVSFIEKERVLSGDFPSPFPYKTNLLFAVPSDAPSPSSPDFQSYVEDTIVRLIEAAGGRTLVLFTSYDSLRSACDTARTRLRSSGITVLKQGDDDRFRLLASFKEDTTSVLFATDSFWEGVDVPGSSLSQVIIVKLPFSVPNDPVFAARAEAVEKRGGSSFMELSVPEAVIKFRQGFGRLIRRNDDRGDVVVLDRRLIDKQYGRLFLNSIPDTMRLFEPLAEEIKKIGSFLNENNS